MKKNVIFLSFFSFIFISIVLYPIVNLLSKDKANSLQQLILEKTQSTLTATIPYFNKAIQNCDDISLISNVEYLSSTPNIASCFILDENNKVIIHNNTNEWNTEKHAHVYSEAVKHKKEFAQKMSDDNFFLLSQPISNNYTLLCIVSIEKSKEIAKYWKIKYYSIALAVAVLITIILYFLSKLFILFPFKRIKRNFENSNSGNRKDKKYNEIDDIFSAEKDKISKKIKKIEEDNKNLVKIIEYSNITSINSSLAFIVLNSSNEIVYYHDSTGKIIKNNIMDKQHILEAVRDPNLIKLVVKANEIPGTNVEEISGIYKICAISISRDDKNAGTLVKVTEN
ncbi:MAG: hypothetical protein LBL71_00115 [Endomicrobium sp.]|jgi:hypothetical protein|nr:hypothetical protein [Endomicrobium sp.]